MTRIAPRRARSSAGAFLARHGIVPSLRWGFVALTLFMIGDGIATDLAAARAVGARCVLMLTGVSTRAEVEALPADQQPTAVAADAAELAAALERLAAA